MIPKLVHYVWLSGEEKPELVKQCLDSWKRNLPDYTIKEWSMKDVEHISSPFLHEAIAARKWAFATDFLRFYIVYHHGGIYMDSDVYIYRNFDPLMDAHGFTSFEGSEILCTEVKKKRQVFALEAAVFGAEKESEWIKYVLSFYEGKHFVNKQSFYMKILAPKVFWVQTVKFGLREIPSFQRLEPGICIYPVDTLSCIADFKLYGLDSFNEFERIGEINPLRFCCHLCNNGWGWQKKKTMIDYLKVIVIKIIGKGNAIELKKQVKGLFKMA